MQSQLQTADLKISYIPLNLLSPSKLQKAESNTAVYRHHESEARAWLQKPLAYDKMMAQSNGRNMLQIRLEGLCSSSSKEKSLSTLCLYLPT